MKKASGSESKITLVMTVDIYAEESGLDPDEVKEDIAEFTRGLLICGAEEQQIGLALRKVECEGRTWTRGRERREKSDNGKPPPCGNRSSGFQISEWII